MTTERKKKLIAEALARVEETLEGRLDALGERSLTLDEIEDLVEEVGLEANAWLEERLIEEQEPAPTNRAPCPKCQQPAPYKETLHSRVLTSHGSRSVRRRYYRCSDCRLGFSPMDLALDLGAGRTATRRVRAWQARYACDEGSFAAVPPLLADLRGLVVSESTVERTTVEVGLALADTNRAAAEAAEAAAPLQETDLATTPEPGPADGPGVERLYLSMDGTMCPLREPWRKDGTLGKLVCSYRETKVGMAFIADRKGGLDTGVLLRGYVATLGKIVPFTLLMVWLARQWGAHRAQELIVLGDGAVWIWKLVQKHFPQAVQILDYWHVLQRLHRIAEARFGSSTSVAGKAWIETAGWELEHDLVECLILNLENWEPLRDEQRQMRDEQVHFLRENIPRLQYGTFLAKGYFLGSGPMESSCKRVVQRRLHEAGMHWREHTAEAMLAIRAHLLSDCKSDLRAWA